MLSFITWDVDPEAFSLFGREIRWYGILWATAVLLTTTVVNRMWRWEKNSDKWFDSLFMHVLTGLIIGARLGHCLFYDPVFYLSHPLKLLAVWEGGLASHGGAIGMTIGVCLFSLRVMKEKIGWKHLSIFALGGFIIGGLCYYIYGTITGVTPSFKSEDGLISILMGLFVGVCISMVYKSRSMSIWTLDRVVIGVAIGAASIRLGNLMNSEIYGGATDMPWGFNFVRDLKWRQMGELPCHPTQIYEALIYLFIFGLGLFLFYKTTARNKTGLILGISLIGIFLSRFLIEFIKNLQEPFEIQMVNTIGINMGQLLSLPFVIWGIYLIYSALKRGETKVNENIKR